MSGTLLALRNVAIFAFWGGAGFVYFRNRNRRRGQ